MINIIILIIINLVRYLSTKNLSKFLFFIQMITTALQKRVQDLRSIYLTRKLTNPKGFWTFRKKRKHSVNHFLAHQYRVHCYEIMTLKVEIPLDRFYVCLLVWRIQVKMMMSKKISWFFFSKTCQMDVSDSLSLSLSGREDRISFKCS